jgi:hypothetical protein
MLTVRETWNRPDFECPECGQGCEAYWLTDYGEPCFGMIEEVTCPNPDCKYSFKVSAYQEITYNVMRK